MFDPERPLAERGVVLFDAGGTLITLDHDQVRACLEHGLAPADEDFDRADVAARAWGDRGLRQGLAARELWNGYFERLLVGAGVPAEEVPGALERLWRRNREVGLWRRPARGAHAVLARLQATGRRIAVVSNAEGQVEADLVAAGFGPFLETVVDSHIVGVRKPDPRIFEIALARLGVVAADCLYVGDVPAFDVDGARAAGIPPVLIDPHDAHPPGAEAARIAALDELPALLGL